VISPADQQNILRDFEKLIAGSFREEVSLPLGKAFLLTSAPWDGYKNIIGGQP
jgi:hypothetical protein